MANEKEFFAAGELSLLVLSYLKERQLTSPGIRRKLLEFPRGSRMPMSVWWQVLEDLYQQESQPDIGIEIGQQAQLFHSGVLGYLIAQNEITHDALLCFQRYQSLLHNYGPLILDEKDGQFCVRWDYLGKQSTLLSDKVFVASLITISKNLTGVDQLIPTEIRFQQTQDHNGANTEALMGCPIIFGAEHLEIRFPVALKNFPFKANDPYLIEIMNRQAEALIRNNENQNDFLIAVENTIMTTLSIGAPEAPVVADKLNMSRRSLHRKLRENGLNFHDVLKDTRLKLAQMYLKDPNLSLTEIAFLLGYSEQSAFTRAFKGWQGESPGSYRSKT